MPVASPAFTWTGIGMMVGNFVLNWRQSAEPKGADDAELSEADACHVLEPLHHWLHHGHITWRCRCRFWRRQRGAPRTPAACCSELPRWNSAHSFKVRGR